MRINEIQRSAVLPAACAPLSGVKVPTMSVLARQESVVYRTAGWTPVATDLPQLSQEHQVQIQAELAEAPVTTRGNNGTNGFLGSKGVPSAKKRMADARGVPPRGRPV